MKLENMLKNAVGFQVVAFSAFVCFALLLSSCASTGSSAHTASGSTSEAVEGAASSGSGANNADSSNSSASAISNGSNTAEKPTNIADIGSIGRPTDFSEGVSWVHAGENTNAGLFQIDKDGTVLFDGRIAARKSSGISNKGGFPIAHDEDTDTYIYSTVPDSYHDGTTLIHVFYSDEKDKSTLADERGNTIIDIKGDIVWSTEKDGWEEGERLFGKGIVTGVYGQNLGTYKGYFFVEYYLNSFDYTGNAIGVLDSHGEWILEPVKHEQKDINTVPDGIVVDRTWSCGYTDQFILDYGSGEVGFFRDMDLDDYGPEEIAYMWDEVNEENLADEGCELIELLDVRGEECYAVFEDDGYELIELENEGGGRFLTVQDASGNRMFEPIPYCAHSCLTEGAFFYDDHYVDANGKSLGTVTGNEGKEFHEGRAWLRIGSEYHCIDLNGKMVF